MALENETFKDSQGIQKNLIQICISTWYSFWGRVLQWGFFFEIESISQNYSDWIKFIYLLNFKWCT